MKRRHILYNRTLRGALVGLVCAAGCWLLAGTAWLRGLEDWALDNCFLVRGRRPSTAKIVIVALDEPSIEALDKPLVYLSPELAEVVAYLRARDAAAVGIDLLLPRSVENIEGLDVGGPGEAEKLGIAAGRAGNVVMPLLLVPGQEPMRPIGQWEPFGGADWTALGYVNLDAEADSHVRRQQLRAADPQGRAWPAFALAMLGLMERRPAAWFSAPTLELDGRPVPLDREGRMPVNYVGPPGTIESVPFSDVLAAARGQGPTGRDWSGAAVLIGLPASTQQDRHATPYLGQTAYGLLRASMSDDGGQLMAGVEVHANILATLADRAFITTPWWLSAPVTLGVLGALLGAIYARASLAWGAAIAFVHHWAWQGLSAAAFCWGGWRVDVVAMLVLGVTAYGVTFALRWRWMRQMFGTFKSEAVAKALEDDPQRSELREITVLFCDVRDFTPFSERHTPEEVVRLLNELFAAVVPPIEAEGGTVNLYIGDGVMALFGAPRPHPDHALRAVRAAAAMLRGVRERQGRWAELGFERLRIGVGIHTGRAVVGAIGSPGRLDYTAIGDTVNTAARIESGNKELGSEVLVSRATRDALPAAEREGLTVEDVPQRLTVKGKEEPLEVYRVREAGFGVQGSGFRSRAVEGRDRAASDGSPLNPEP